MFSVDMVRPPTVEVIVCRFDGFLFLFICADGVVGKHTFARPRSRGYRLPVTPLRAMRFSGSSRVRWAFEGDVLRGSRVVGSHAAGTFNMRTSYH